MKSDPVIMMVAAEASGDVLGADLIAALRRRVPNASFVGLGGERMAKEGLASAFDMTELSIFGIFDALAAYPRVRRRLADLATLAARERPDVAILIDSWGFTSRLAEILRRKSPKVRLVKYVGPQVWASRPGRAKTLAARFDHLLSILPLDAPFYEQLDVPVTFVGNPVLQREIPSTTPMAGRAALDPQEGGPILAVLPGSRAGEIKRMLPVFEAAISIVRQTYPDLQVIIPAASTVAQSVRARVASWPFRAQIVEGEEAKREAMRTATVALACSGTVTTELALAGCPMVVAYRIGPASYAVAKRLVKTRYITLLNIAAGREVAPEFIQARATGPLLAEAVKDRLADPTLRARQIEAQNDALKKMGRGGPDPSEKAADVIVDLLSRPTTGDA